MTPPFKAEQIGSLLRPQSLIAAHNVYASDSSPESSSVLANVRKAAIASVISEQLARSIRPITSGEYERFIFYSDFFDRLSGFKTESIPITSFISYFPTVATLVAQGISTRNAVICTGPIRHVESPLLVEWLHLRSLLPTQDLWNQCKITIPSPTYFHMQLQKGLAYPSEVYASDEAFFADVTAAYRREFEMLYAAGVRNIQVDDPNRSFFCDENYIRGLIADGIDPAVLLDFYINVHNECLKGLPESLHVGIHICRGNAPNSTHYSSGSYEPIAARAFSTLAYSTFYLEFDTSRAGTFEPLRFVPPDKNVVLGLVTTKFPDIEATDELVARVQEAASVIAKEQGGVRTREQILRENLAISPQCGFSSGMVGGGKGVTETVQWEKLKLVREVAMKIWEKDV